MLTMIILTSFMDGDKDILKRLCKEVKVTIGECRILDNTQDIPQDSLDPVREQYDSK